MTTRAPSIAIIGSGPSGLYAADALLRRQPDALIDIYERLPTPFGLVRSGVAPDHPGTKAVVRQFERMMERSNVRFLGNVEIGRDVDMADIRAAYDLIFVATGAAQDRRLGIAGEDLPGVYGSGTFSRWYNGHPDQAELDPAIGRHVAIIGMGNVALDIARILVRDPDALAETDISATALAMLRASRASHITLFARGGPGTASFTAAEMLGLGAQPDIAFAMDGAIDASHPDPAIEKRLAALRALPDQPASRTIRLAFHHTPLAIEGDGKVQRLVARNLRTGAEHSADVDMIITAIGFETPAIPGLSIQHGHIDCDADGRIAENIYALGWAKRGPSGTIPTNRQEAQIVVKQALEQWVPSPARHGGDIADRLAASEHRLVRWNDWKRIDAHELRQPQRARQKLLTRETLLNVAHERISL